MSNNRNPRASALALAVLGTLFVGQAAASGFQLREQSVKNVGRSGAGSGVAQGDAAVVSLNPAAMTNLDSRTFQVDGTVIDLTAKFTGGGTVLGLPGAVPGATLTGGNGGDPGDPTLVPNMSVVFPMHGALEGLYLGASVGAPFGLATDYDAGWVGRYRALKSEVKTIDLTLSAAFKFDNGFSIGAGLIYERGEATLSKGIDFGTAICAQAAASVPTSPLNTCFNPAWPLYPAYHPQSADGDLIVHGTDNAFGYLVGFQYAPNDQFAIGLSYRSEIRQKLQGSLDFNGVPAILGADPRFKDGPGGAVLDTPDVTTLSVRYAFTEDFRLMADIQRTGWSSLPSVVITRSDGTLVGAEDFSWSDSTFYSVGGEYDISDAFTLRFGVGHDKTPTNDITRTPRLPDNDRMLYSIGATWHVSENLSLDAAYQRITIKTPHIALPVDLAHSNTSSLIGSFSGHANLFGVSMQYRF